MVRHGKEARMRRVIGIDIHRTFGEVVIWENGVLRREGRVEMTRTALEGFGRRLEKSDEVVIEATGNCMAVSRVPGGASSRCARSSPRGRPRRGRIPPDATRVLSITSVECSFARCWAGKVM
jgi:hypothetical protein